MRILHVITKLDVGGAQSVVLELARAQRNSQQAVMVATGLGGPVAEQLRDAGIGVTVLDSLVHPLSPRQDGRTVKDLVHLIRSFKPDIVHTHSSKGGLLGRIAARRCRVPSVYTAHGWPFQAGARRSQQAQSLVGEWVAGRLGDEVVCVTEVDGRPAERLHVGRRGHRQVIPNGIAALPVPVRVVRRQGDPFRLVMVARLSPPKRPDLVVDALSSTPSDVVLTIVGDGDLAEAVRAEVSARRLTDRVALVGLCDPTPYLEQADAFCLMSDYEGMPMTVLEAMRAGLPVIANRLPGIDEAVGGDAGVLCRADASSLAAAIESLYNDPQRAYEMGKAGRLRWETQFSASLMCEKYEQLYRSMVGGLS